MKLRNWVAGVIAITLVTIGSLVFAQVQNAKATDVNGTADNVTSTNITVGNKTLVIDSNTKIIGELVSGSFIQIRAKVQDDGTLLATKIQVKNNKDHKQYGNSDNVSNDNHKQNKDDGKTGQWHQDNGRHLERGKQQQQNKD